MKTIAHPGPLTQIARANARAAMAALDAAVADDLARLVASLNRPPPQNSYARRKSDFPKGPK